MNLESAATAAWYSVIAFGQSDIWSQAVPIITCADAEFGSIFMIRSKTPGRGL